MLRTAVSGLDAQGGGIPTSSSEVKGVNGVSSFNTNEPRVVDMVIITSKIPGGAKVVVLCEHEHKSSNGALAKELILPATTRAGKDRKSSITEKVEGKMPALLNGSGLKKVGNKLPYRDERGLMHINVYEPTRKVHVDDLPPGCHAVLLNDIKNAVRTGEQLVGDVRGSDVPISKMTLHVLKTIKHPNLG